MRRAIVKSQLHRSVKSASEKALDIIETAPRIRLNDLKDNPGARTEVYFFLINFVFY
jgi:hypothetical protein